MCIFHNLETDRSASGNPKDVCFLYRSCEGDKPDVSLWSHAVAKIGRALTDGIKRVANSSSKGKSDCARSTLASAMSRALCYIFKAQKNVPDIMARMLVLHTSDTDDPSQYMSVMNAIFCAEKNGVPIDACLMSQRKSSFLQRATEITKGVYKKLSSEYQDGLIIFLFTLFFSNTSARKLLKLPRPDEMSVEFSVTCFLQAKERCCHNSLAKAFICSVCLSIFCKQQTVCPICKRKVKQVYGIYGVWFVRGLL